MKKPLLALSLVSAFVFAAQPKYHYGQVVEFKDAFFGNCKGVLERVESNEAGHVAYGATAVRCDTGYKSQAETVLELNITKVIK
jgi:hypothetical protein